MQGTKEVVELLSIESVSVCGVLIVVIWLLISHIRKLEKEKSQYREEVKEVYQKMEDDWKNSNEEIKEIIGKYHTITAKILEKLS